MKTKYKITKGANGYYAETIQDEILIDLKIFKTKQEALNYIKKLKNE